MNKYKQSVEIIKNHMKLNIMKNSILNKYTYLIINIFTIYFFDIIYDGVTFVSDADIFKHDL